MEFSFASARSIVFGRGKVQEVPSLMQSLGVGYVGADALAVVGPLGGGANGLPSVSSCLSE